MRWRQKRFMFIWIPLAFPTGCRILYLVLVKESNCLGDKCSPLPPAYPRAPDTTNCLKPATCDAPECITCSEWECGEYGGVRWLPDLEAAGTECVLDDVGEGLALDNFPYCDDYLCCDDFELCQDWTCPAGYTNVEGPCSYGERRERRLSSSSSTLGYCSDSICCEEGGWRSHVPFVDTCCQGSLGAKGDATNGSTTLNSAAGPAATVSFCAIRGRYHTVGMRFSSLMVQPTTACMII